MNGIFLTGFMASGKTTVGRVLAARLGYRFADLDDDIETTHGFTIPELFQEHGEEKFREFERDALRARLLSIAAGTATVLALGGGAYAQPGAPALLASCGVSIWLDCPWEVVAARIDRNGGRPLARNPERFERLYHERRAIYSQAQYRVPILHSDPEKTVNQILALPPFQS